MNNLKNYFVTVNISLKDGVLDPQGRAVQSSLKGLGYIVENMRLDGRYQHIRNERYWKNRNKNKTSLAGSSGGKVCILII